MTLVDGNIVGSVAGATPGQCRAYLRRHNGGVLADAEQDEVVRAFYTLAPLLPCSPSMAFAMSCHETNIYRFGGDVIPEQHNPAGIGTTGGGVRGLYFPTWTRGIEAFFAHLMAWLGGPGAVPGLHHLYTTDLDPRIPIVERVRAQKGVVTTWRSLGGRWAVRNDVPWQEQATMPGNYGEGLERHWQAILAQPKEEPMGHVPKPPIKDRTIGIPPKVAGVGVDWGGKRAPKFSVVHSMVGTLWGTDGWFRRSDVKGLTDFGIGIVDVGDGFAEILQWCDPFGTLIPWASGPVLNPEGDGPRALAAFGGAGGVNRHGVSIELDDRGDTTTPVSPPQWSSLCWMLAFVHAEWLGQTADTFDWNMHHHEFCGDGYKKCPFSRVRDHTAEYQEAVKAIMRHWQWGTPYPAGGVFVAGKRLALPTRQGAVPVQPSDGDTYVVRAGDTLAKIAAAHGIATADLQAWNGIENPNLIRVGQELRVRAPAPPQPPAFEVPGFVRPAVLDRLRPGEGLGRGERIASGNSRFTLILQEDGNLVLYGPDRALWATGTDGREGRAAIMQPDGNLVLYGPQGPLWASGTAGRAVAELVVQDDGNLVLYGPAPPPPPVPVEWASNTAA